MSRRKDGTPPVVIEPRESYIEVHNRRNSNGITVKRDDGQTELPKGRTETVSDTARIELGYRTTLVMRVEKEARFNIGSVSGDVVAGDQTNVDERTQVVDSVVNRSEIGGNGSGTVEDSVVNRSQVGGESQSDDSDTKGHCEEHDRIYTGEACPECLAEQSSSDEPAETRFCLYCGTEIPASAAVCPECRADQSTS